MIGQGGNFITRWIDARHFQIADDYNYKGLEYYENEQYNEAIDSFTKAIAGIEEYQFDKVGDYYSNRAQAYFMLGRYEEAIKDYNMALGGNSDKELLEAINAAYLQIAERFNKMGIKFYEKKEYEEAVNYFSKAIMKLEEYGIKDVNRYYINRAQAYSYLGEYEKALADYTSAMNIKEDKGILNAILSTKQQIVDEWNLKAIEAYNQGDYKGAINNYSEAIMYSEKFELKNTGNYYFERAQVYYFVEDYEMALEDYMSALIGNVDNDDVLNAIDITERIILNNYKESAIKEYNKGNYKSAVKYYSEAIEHSKAYGLENAENIYFERAQVYFLMGEYEKALADYTEVAKTDASENILKAIESMQTLMIENCKAKGAEAFKRGDYESAIENYSKIIEVSKKYEVRNLENYYFERAQAYFSKGDYELALEDYTAALNGGENDEIVNAIEVTKQCIINDYAEKGKKAYNEEKYEQAIGFYSKEIMYIKAYGLGDIGNSYYNRAQAYFLLENYSQALTDYFSALDIHESKSLLYAISVTYERLGITVKAEEYKKKAEKYYD
ncbi:MAG: tetratricopeptide repeat protein [Lachnospiraceae bacterium]|nr:tetratricopeptide repeat protein [Lachnospiraceae bacterium]